MKNLKLISIVVAILGILIYFEYTTPKPINWKVTLSRWDKAPYGTYIVFNELDKIFPMAKIETNQITFDEYSYKLDEYLDEYSETDHLNEGFIFINKQFAPTQSETEHLLNIVSRGATVLIATENLRGSLADRLGINQEYHHFWVTPSFTTAPPEDTIAATLVQKNIIKDNVLYDTDTTTYFFKKSHVSYYFDINSSKHIIKDIAVEVIGTVADKPNYIKIKHGNGMIILHASPLTFTNYNALSDTNNQYISSLLSHLSPNLTKLVWDDYYTLGRGEIQTPLRYILSNSSLSWAWFTTLSTLFIFMIFNAKRKQREIAEITPLKNSTIHFVQTIGRLYYQTKDHKNIALKKITYLKEYLRTNYYIDTNLPQEELVEIISLKTEKSKDSIRDLLILIDKVQQNSAIVDENLLIKLHNSISSLIKKK